METIQSHYLPEMPEIGEEVLVAYKWSDIPLQSYWDGKFWRGSLEVRSVMEYVICDDSRSDVQKSIYAWCKLPTKPEVKE